MNNNIERIFSIETKRTFTLQEAKDLLPLVYFVTESSFKTVKKMINRLDGIKDSDLILAAQVEEQINHEVEKWQNKLTRLGVKPKGLWLADFDFGQGYYCWKFPETDISFKHGYQDGFSGRVEIE